MRKGVYLLDLFSGIGGFALGLQRAGFKLDRHAYSEVDPHALAVYAYQFKHSFPVGSITDLNIRNLGKPDIITFGSPCQDFSYAGSREGLKGQKSQLLGAAIAWVKKLRPGIFIWENVKGAFSTNEGRDFQAVLQAFTHLRGYRLEWQLLNTRWFLPQHRERIYLIGHLAQKSAPRVFPFQEGDPVFNASRRPKRQKRQRVQSQPVISTLNTRYAALPNAGETYLYVYSGLKQGYEIACKGDIVDLAYPTSTTRKSRVQRGQAKTLDSRCHQGIFQNRGIRKLTEIECERLQGFPDNWTHYGKYEDGVVRPLSKTARYALIGNAVTTDVVKAIGQRLLH